MKIPESQWQRIDKGEILYQGCFSRVTRKEYDHGWKYTILKQKVYDLIKYAILRFWNKTIFDWNYTILVLKTMRLKVKARKTSNKVIFK